MGQQQLLLLVLATVIVGLATVAGIQAFDENRRQAAADALTQKATTLAADVKGVDEKPEQFGGLDLSNTNTSATDVAQALGFSKPNGNNSGTYSSAVSGAGATGNCVVQSIDNSTPSVTIRCTGSDDYSDLTFDAVYKPTADPEVSVSSN